MEVIVYLLNIYELNTYNVPDIVLVAKDIVVSKSRRECCAPKVMIQWETDFKQIMTVIESNTSHYQSHEEKKSSFVNFHGNQLNVEGQKIIIGKT